MEIAANYHPDTPAHIEIESPCPDDGEWTPLTYLTATQAEQFAAELTGLAARARATMADIQAEDGHARNYSTRPGRLIVAYVEHEDEGDQRHSFTIEEAEWWRAMETQDDCSPDASEDAKRAAAVEELLERAGIAGYVYDSSSRTI